MLYMLRKIKSTGQQGFTLVELLIVVIILAVLAAIVVPQFSSSTDEAKISALDSTLSNMRAAIDLYYQQHSGKYPGDVAATGASCTATLKGSGAKETFVAFQSQMTLYTNISGEACGAKDVTFKYGPYLKKPDLPQNPLTENSALSLSISPELGMAADGGSLGWKYNVKTGQFIANDDTLDASGTNTYATH